MLCRTIKAQPRRWSDSVKWQGKKDLRLRILPHPVDPDAFRTARALLRKGARCDGGSAPKRLVLGESHQGYPRVASVDA
jgi:hypothetical protein